jgi:hypothetical protein
VLNQRKMAGCCHTGHRDTRPQTQLPDDRPMLPPELPPALPLPDPQHNRWVSRDKQHVVLAVVSGWLTLRQACQLYQLSIDEFLAWRRRAAKQARQSNGIVRARRR